jgi:hypothetical protein
MFIQIETGLPLKDIKAGLQGLTREGFIKYDSRRSVVWIVKMARYQIKGGSSNKNMMDGIGNHFKNLHKTPLIKDFLQYYNDFKIALESPLEDPSESLAESGEGECIKEKEKEKEKGEGESGLSPDSSPPQNLHGEFKNVKLTEEEFEKLNLLYGSKTVSDYVEKLSGYLKAKGKKYHDHYATLLNWLRKDGVAPFNLCTGKSPMPPGEKDRARWRHPETKEVKHKDTGRTARKCLYCNSIQEGT